MSQDDNCICNWQKDNQMRRADCPIHGTHTIKDKTKNDDCQPTTHEKRMSEFRRWVIEKNPDKLQIAAYVEKEFHSDNIDVTSVIEFLRNVARQIFLLSKEGDYKTAITLKEAGDILEKLDFYIQQKTGETT